MRRCTTAGQVRAGPQWLALREPADAAARAPEFVGLVRAHLRSDGASIVHDLGCGTGSMARWLSASLPGPQRWIMYDRDPELLALATAAPSGAASDGSPVTAVARRRDVTRLSPRDLHGADLVTASALLDVLTAEELERLLASCVRPRCPVLITLSVTGDVDLSPADPFDQRFRDAFNAHQRRTTGSGRLLGPDAVDAAVDGFARRGFEVTVLPSPWRLGAHQTALATAWLSGWLSAACEQLPELGAAAPAYGRRRAADRAAGRLSITVHHADLFARPARSA